MRQPLTVSFGLTDFVVLFCTAYVNTENLRPPTHDNFYGDSQSRESQKEGRVTSEPPQQKRGESWRDGRSTSNEAIVELVDRGFFEVFYVKALDLTNHKGTRRIGE